MSNSVSATRPVSFTAPAQGEATQTRRSPAGETTANAATAESASSERASQQSEPINQREAVRKLYAEKNAQPSTNEAEVENAREAVKQLYAESILEKTQRLVMEGGQREAQSPLNSNAFGRSQKIRNAMAIDKAAAQEARLQAQRLEVQDKVIIAREQNYREHFEAFALARDLIALKDSELDRQEIAVKESVALENDEEALQQDKAASATNTRLIQQRDEKLNQVVSKTRHDHARHI